MEKLLLKMARQLDALDEASLMALWSKYAVLTERFEPTRRWEEACLVFSLIQAKHMKNQLFNYCWSKQKMPPLKNSGEEPSNMRPFEFDFEPAPPETSKASEPAPCRIISFTTGKLVDPSEIHQDDDTLEETDQDKKPND